MSLQPLGGATIIEIRELTNMKTNEIRCLWLGLRSGKTSPKGFTDARFDEVMIAEPFPNKFRK